MKRILLFVLLLGLGINAHAEEKAKTYEVKAYMDQMLAQIFVLKPYLVSGESFKDPKNSKQIASSLKTMVELSKKINHEERIKKTGFQISGNVLNQQLEEVESVFNSGHKDYALWTLRSTLGVCMSCHTQLPAVSTKFSTMNESHLLVNPFEEAEFLFVIRNFDAALKLYEKTIAEYPRNMVPVVDVEKAIYRQLYYYVRVARDFKGLVAALKQDKKNKQLPKFLKDRIQSLIGAADAMKNEKYPQFTEETKEDLRKFAEKALKEELSGDFSVDLPKKEISALKVSSVLYEYLNLYPNTTMKPEILYWLSFCERRYRYHSMYSLPELYLKQCVLEYPQSPVAKKCLAEYQDLMTMAFTGSSGTHMPEDISKELKTMQELIKKVK